MAFPESFLQELAERNSIEDVVGSYVRLTKRSGANLFGLCPFHNEKTPSFSVSPDKQIYHCFGCGKGGSVINFIMEIENLSFPDAVAFLARRAGMQVPEDGDKTVRDQRERLLALNKEAARFFYAELLKPSGKPAQDYICQREIRPAMAKSFGLGFAPDSFYALSDAMREKGFQDFELVSAGLANGNKSGKGVHDVFRGRLMFPVIDVRGNVIGFSGRRLDGEKEQKYLNTRNTSVFDKSRNLFGLNLAKKSKSGYILLVEGNIDVVSLHQAGFDSAVASLGTALTAEQARLISRYKNEVVIAYDGDAAGQKAAQRAIGVLSPLDLKVRVLQMEGAKDPDEFIKTRGPDAFANLLSASETHVLYQLGKAADGKDLQSDEGRVAYLKAAVDIIARLPSPVEREIYAMRAAETVGVPKEVVVAEAERQRKIKAASAKKQREQEDIRKVVSTAQPASRQLRYDNPFSAVAEEGVIRLLWLDPALLTDTDLKPEEFTSPLLGRVYRILREKAAEHVPFTPTLLSSVLSGEEEAHVTKLLQESEEMRNAETNLRDYINTIRKEQQMSLSASDADLIAFRDNKRNHKG